MAEFVHSEENGDIGRPDHVQLIFERRITRRTPSQYRSRVITEGVAPSLHADYKHSRIKQYHKEGRALRTETVVNDTYDFGIGRRLCKRSKANRLRGQPPARPTHDSLLGTDTFDQLHRPVVVDNRRVSALRFGEPRVVAIRFAGFSPTSRSFANRQLREHAAPGLFTDT